MRIGYQITISIRSILCVFLLFSITARCRGGGYAQSQVGERAFSLGGAFRGLADDWSAAHWNPAGLDNLTGPAVTYSFSSRTPFFTFHPSAELPGMDGRLSVEEPRTSVALPAVSFFNRYAFQERRITAGVAVFHPYFQNSRWDLYDIPFHYTGGRSYPETDHTVEFSITDIHPAVAFELLRNLSFGFGLSIYHGTLLWQRLRLMDGGDLPYPVSRIPADEVIDWNGWGIGANAGFLYRPGRRVSIGCSASIAPRIGLSGDVKRSMYIPEALRDRYDGVDYIEYTLTGSTRLHLPERVGIGVAVTPFYGFLLTGDAQYERWNGLNHGISLRYDGQEPDGGDVPDEDLLLRWRNTWSYSVGASYQLFPLFHLRSGYSFAPSPAPDRTFFPFLGEIGDSNAFHAGFSYRNSDFTIDCAYGFCKTDNRFVRESSDLNADGVIETYAGEYLGKSHTCMIGLTFAL